MKRETDVRDILIENTIHLIAEGGFEKATTYAITHTGQKLRDIKMNEAYIYRLFGGKEKLYDAVFNSLDRELVGVLQQSITAVGDSPTEVRDKLYAIFEPIWRFVLSNEEHCRCYVRYYYSAYFKGGSLQKHNEQFDTIIKRVSPIFNEQADVTAIMHSVFTAMLDFAVRVYNGDLEDKESNTPHVFTVLYGMMANYLKNKETPMRSTM